MNTTLNLNSNEIINWFNAIRALPDTERTRALEGFWSTQIQGKCWLVNTLNDYVHRAGNVYIFGGWIGVLGNLLIQGSKWKISAVRSIDIDPWCESVADTLNAIHVADGWRFRAETSNMRDYIYDWNIWPDVVINTSTEHVDQETYDAWWDKIPAQSIVVLQGNNYFNCKEHIRCSSSLQEFLRMNHVVDPLHTGELKNNMYSRYMAIFKKP